MRAPGELFYWKQNKEWWTIDKQTDEFILTENATEEAKDSFSKYKEYIERRKK